MIAKGLRMATGQATKPALLREQRLQGEMKVFAVHTVDEAPGVSR